MEVGVVTMKVALTPSSSSATKTPCSLYLIGRAKKWIVNILMDRRLIDSAIE